MCEEKEYHLLQKRVEVFIAIIEAESRRRQVGSSRRVKGESHLVQAKEITGSLHHIFLTHAPTRVSKEAEKVATLI